MPELFNVQMADALPCNSAATATSRGLSDSVVAKEIALSDGATAKWAIFCATCRAGVAGRRVKAGHLCHVETIVVRVGRPVQGHNDFVLHRKILSRKPALTVSELLAQKARV
eukprot:s3356_g6.t1